MGNWGYFTPINGVISPYLQLDPGRTLYGTWTIDSTPWRRGHYPRAI